MISIDSIVANDITAIIVKNNIEQFFYPTKSESEPLSVSMILVSFFTVLIRRSIWSGVSIPSGRSNIFAMIASARAFISTPPDPAVLSFSPIVPGILLSPERDDHTANRIPSGVNHSGNPSRSSILPRPQSFTTSSIITLS